MIRNLKVLGLALVAVFAFTAMAASAASAAQFTSGSDSTTLTSKALTAQTFKEGETEVTCTGVSGTATGVGTTAATVTVEPQYSGCSIVVGGSTVEAQVDSNGCHYTFTAASAVDVACPTEKSIEVTAFLLGKFRKCLDVGTQGGLSVDYTNGTEVTGGNNVWDVTVKSTATKVVFSKTGSCGVGKFENATYTGEVTVWGEDSKENPVNVTWDA